MINKFTKWIVAKPVTIAEASQVLEFISGMVHLYGVPHSITMDNGTSFMAKEVKAWCAWMGIQLDYASVYHPQTSGQVKHANGLVLSGIKPCFVLSLKEADCH